MSAAVNAQAIALRNQTTEIERRERPLEETMSLAEIFAKSGFFNDAKEMAKCAVKIIAGAELGLSPVVAMRSIYVINGQTSIAAIAMAAIIKRSRRYTYLVLEHTDKKCAIKFFENNNQIGVSEFTIEDAAKAGALEKPGSNWKKHPKNMLFARAMSNGAKWYCADLFGGAVYDPEELGAGFNTETGEYIPTTTTESVQSTPVAPVTRIAEAEPEISFRQKTMQECHELIKALRVMNDELFTGSSPETRKHKVMLAFIDCAKSYNWTLPEPFTDFSQVTDEQLSGFAGWLEGRRDELQEKAFDELARQEQTKQEDEVF